MRRQGVEDAKGKTPIIEPAKASPQIEQSRSS